MGRRGGGTRRKRPSSLLSPAVIEERIEECKLSHHLSPEEIADQLYFAFPDYRHYKLIPFRFKITKILQQCRRREDNSAVEEGNESELRVMPSRKKRKHEIEHERESSLLRREYAHFYRRRRSNEAAIAPCSSVSAISSDEEVDAAVPPEFDVMKSMLREGYIDVNSKSTGFAIDLSGGDVADENLRGGDDAKVTAVAQEFDVNSKSMTFAVNLSGGGEVAEDNLRGGFEAEVAAVAPEFDVMKSMLRERYIDTANSKSKSKSTLNLVKSEKNSSDFEAKSEGSKGPRFRDFGGIKKELEELEWEVIQPLRHPKLLHWLNVKPVSGILLHGPPGCGKTRLARAIAIETGFPFYQISAPELVSGVTGGSEEKIRDLFSKAYETAPSIVFIDEFDAIASKRENTQKEMGRRIVTQLLTCMDEFHGFVKRNGEPADSESVERSGYVLVVGATNRPDSIDPALRRPGRFDKEILLPVPDENARSEILSLLTKNTRLEGDFDVKKLARATPGFVGADLSHLINKAGILAMKRFIDLRRLGLSDEGGKQAEYPQDESYEDMEKLNILMVDFEEAAKMVQPSLRREGFSVIPKVTWEDVGGLNELRKEFERHIVERIKYPELYEKVGVELETGYLLFGPPGCGKTLIAKAVAHEAGANFIHIKGPELLNKYVGESESHVRSLFHRARTCSPCILFFDEVDALTTERGKEGGWVVERLLNQLLIELDGGEHRRGVYVIGATNRPDVVDRALLRPGRFGKPLYVPLPKPDERGLILQALARRKPIDVSVNLLELGQSEICENLSGADLAELMEQAAMALRDEILPAFEEELESKQNVFAATGFTIKLSHFEQARSKITPSVSEEQKRHYDELSKSFGGT